MVAIIAAPSQDSSKVGIKTYEVVDYGPQMLKLKLEFVAPEYISTQT